MANIGDKALGWSKTAGANTMATPDGWPEGQPPSTVNDCARAMMAAVRVWYNDPQWIEYGDGEGPYTAAYVSATAFSIAGTDVSVVYHVGRRVRVTAPTPGTLYGTISGVSFATDTTVTVAWDSGSLANETPTSVFVGALSATNVSYPSALGTVPRVPVRQCVLSAVTSGGAAAAITTGSGLKPGLLATAAPFVMTFAGGFNAGGAVDTVEVYSADIADAWTCPASNLSFLYVDRSGPGATARGRTLAPPQYGPVYDRSRQALLAFEGTAGSTAIIDGFGNGWTVVGGAKLVSDQKKFGSTALGGGGASNALVPNTDYVRTTSITSLGPGSWAMRGWFFFTATPTNVFLVALGNGATTIGGILTSGGKLYGELSSTGSAPDIMNAVGGTVLSAGQWYFVEVTFDQENGKYIVYLNGAPEIVASSSAKHCAFTSITLGTASNVSAGMAGYIDAFEILPYCDHSNGTTYSVPTVASDMTTAGYGSDWFNTSAYTMNSISGPSAVAGTDPTFARCDRLYVGEATTGVTSVSNVMSYAAQGKYTSAWTNPVPSAGTPISFNDNIGTDLKAGRLEMRNLTTEGGYTPGDVVEMLTQLPGLYWVPFMFSKKRNYSLTAVGSSYGLVGMNPTSGGCTTPTYGNFAYRAVFLRSF